MNSVEASISAREYWASDGPAGLQAPNRRNDLRTFFEPDGIRVHDRDAQVETRLVGLSLVEVGRGGALDAVPPGEVTHHEGRVEIARRELALVEWFENGASGLEQGFDLARRPAVDVTSPLVLELAVEEARAAIEESTVVLTTVSGRRLSYGGLLAEDAAGVRLASHFEVDAPDRIRLIIDDRGAAYPIRIDPILTGAADRQIESNQSSALLGESVAGAGDVNGDGYADLIVGAYLYDNGQADEGAAFVFLGSSSGITGTQPGQAAAVLESNQINAGFGYGVASAGDVNGDGYADVLVGSYLYDKGETDEGAAFVFLGSATGIASGNPLTAATTLESNQVNAQMGYAVAGAGDVNADGFGDVIVGAYLFDNFPLDEGVAFVFQGSASGVASGGPLVAASRMEGDQLSANLGMSVSGAGDVNGDGYDDVIVGAPYFDAPHPGGFYADAGAAFVFLGSPTGVLGSGTLLAPTHLYNDQPTQRFGESVASAGDTNGDGYAEVMVGAIFYEAGETAEGAAFVFSGSAAGIANGGPATATARLESNQSGARMGATVGSVGDVNGDGYGDVVVGAYGYDTPTLDAGAAFVFYGGLLGVANGNPSTADGRLLGTQDSAFSGYSAAGAGDVDGDGYADVVVGTFLYDGGQVDEGAASIYLGGSRGIRSGNPLTASATLEANQAAAQMASSVASAGDVNGDGYSDVIVGSYAYDNGQTDEGAAFVFLGGPNGVSDGNPASAATMLESNQANAHMGVSIASAGDVNGDGYDDVIVGAFQYSNPELNEGAAFLYSGSAAGIPSGGPANAAATFESDQANAHLGRSVASAGDVNGDGFADLILGADLYDDGQPDEGAAFVFLGRPAWIAHDNPANADATLESNLTGSEFGFSVGGAGDVNGDGHADVIVGAYAYDDGQVDEGAAFVFLGSPSGIIGTHPGVAAAVLESNQVDAQFGTSVASAGNVNGDGYADVIVGSSHYDKGETDEGVAFVFLGSATGIASGSPLTAATTLESNQAVSIFGLSVASAGDVNGDGFADVVVGAPGYSDGESTEGAAFVFMGSATGIANGNPANAAALIESNQAFSGLGFAVSGAGDVNGDGFGDLIVGDGFYNRGELHEGAAFVHLGNTAGRPSLARQRRGDGSGVAVQSFGLSRSSTSFVAELRAGHPQVAGRIKAQWQACPAGVAFGSPICTNVVSPTWVGVNRLTPEATIAQTIPGLADRTLYHWRARALFAPKTGPLPANPPHGPWRRLAAQSVEGDIRVPEPRIDVALLAGLLVMAGLAKKRSRFGRAG